jgi:hypothetical protein
MTTTPCRALQALCVALALQTSALGAQPFAPAPTVVGVRASVTERPVVQPAALEEGQPAKASPRRRAVIGAVGGASVGLLASLLVPVGSCAMDGPNCPSALSTRARLAVGWSAGGAAVGALVGVVTTRRATP